MINNKFFYQKPQNVQVGSGNVIQEYGSKDPDLKEIVTYSQHWLTVITFKKSFGSQGFHFERMRR
jgi:hypothetical protein